MGRLYTDEDVNRWEKTYDESIVVHLAKLATVLPTKLIDFHLGMLSLSYHSQGMTRVAKGRFHEAIDSFRASVETKCMMYMRYENGEGEQLEAGEFQSILLSFITKDNELISRFANYYRADVGTSDSLFLGRALKCIMRMDLDDAKQVLRQKKPRFETQFTGYPDCLEAIADKDSTRFVNAINVASQSWTKWASKTVKGLPGSVCFIQGVGLILLAERVIGQPISITNEYIPAQLL